MFIMSFDITIPQQVWNRIAPGLASQFDSPYTLPSLAPRPLIVINGTVHYQFDIFKIKVFFIFFTTKFKYILLSKKVFFYFAKFQLYIHVIKR